MFKVFRTLVAGSSARAEEKLTDHFAIELIEQKVREAQSGLKSAKMALASLMQREMTETRQIEALQTRIAELSENARAALKAGEETLATEAAGAVAQMENELALREQTMRTLQSKILRLRQSVETGNRRIIDLKQGAVMARAVRQEQRAQGSIRNTFNNADSITEAEELINRVMGAEDPFEQGEILAKIDADLNQDSISDRLADAGYGAASKVTASAVLARFKD